MSKPEERSGLEVALIGMAGRFPGARDVEAFWSNLRAGVESVCFFTDAELRTAGVDPAVLADPGYVPASAVLDDIDRFDAAFFGVTPRDAEIMDPQHRVFLECAWAALENAGHDPARPPGLVGVYGGISTNGYLQHNLLRNELVESESLSALFGNQSDYLTTRVSYKLNLKGPSLDVQTSCSTSLVAVHLACQALLSGECDLALAGGVSITVPHGRGYIYQEQGIYSPDGHCKAFSSDAQGTIGGSGGAIVVLRRLQDALDDGDTIRAVIRGSAINNDGSAKVGYAAPSVDGQAQVIRNAQTMADVHPESISYVETHGTGTTLGDPIEIAALTAAFRSRTGKTGFCAIGSVKTNIGHLDVAAGITGLIKTTLALENRELPPSLHCQQPDPEIDFPSTPFVVNTELARWDAETPRRAGVSSFGIGGTNAHVILEEAPESRTSAPVVRPEQLLVLSARSPTALDHASTNLAKHLRAHPDLELANVAWTLQEGRAEFAHRRVVVGRDSAGLAEALESRDRQRVRSYLEEGVDRSAVFMFPGQGAQYVQMGRDLYAREPVFREQVDHAAELLVPHLGLDLREVLYPEPDGAKAAAEQLGETTLTQPALFVLEHALSQLWIEWGIQPQAMIGHSVGEYVAATLSGVFTLSDALGLVAARGRLMQELPQGDMLAVQLPADEVELLLADGVSMAAINEPSSCVVSGTPGAVAALEQRLRDRNVACRRLHTSHAFHSAMMDPILGAFKELVRAVPRRPPEIPFVSTLTGTWIVADDATDPAYWARHLRQPVRFAAGLTELLADSRRVFLEVGPGNTLTTLGVRIEHGRRVSSEVSSKESNAVFTASMRHPRSETSDHDCLLGALGQVWLSRVPINWRAVHGGTGRRRVPLPTYPFERERYWVEPDAERGRTAPSVAAKRTEIAEWFYVPSWKRSASFPSTDSDPHASRVLVFGDSGGLGAELAGRLGALGKQVSVVTAGARFMVEDEQFTMRPGNHEDTLSLLRELDERGQIPQIVVHLWGADATPAMGKEAEAAQERGFFSLLHLVQAIGVRSAEADGWSKPLRILAVTRNLHEVTGSETLVPQHATLLGACQAIRQECAAITCRSIDLDHDTDPAAAAACVLYELQGSSEDAVVAWRGDHRWVQVFEPTRISAPARDGDALPGLLRERGHYLVTGGLGSIGLEVANCLARAARARLVLTGRRSFPKPEDWGTWLASHPVKDATSRRIRRLEELRALGAEVWVACADVTDGNAMAAVLREAEARFGALNGVVHCAGAEKVMSILQETDRATCEAQFRPKIRGLAVLEELFEDRALDFCVVQSSLSSCLGALGMVGYVAAHQYVDAFVVRHNSTHRLPWTRVNWDNWLSYMEPEYEHTHAGESWYMTPEDGAEAFLRVLSLPTGAQLVVSTGELQARIARWAEGGADHDAKPEPQRSFHARPHLESDYEAPSTPAEQILVRVWREILGIGEIGVHDSFFELGGDSVLGLQVVARAGQAGLRITPAQIFEHPSVSALAAVAESSAPSGAEQGEVSGSAPLLPIQRWFFEQDFPDPHHFNLPMLFEVPDRPEPELLSRVLADVVAHHDALRLRYTRNDTGIEQTHVRNPGEIVVPVVDLTAIPTGEREATMRARATALHQSLDLAAGPLMSAALFQLESGQPPQLLWIIHHLLVDMVSWRVLLEDFHTALRQRQAGKSVALPPKTTSFRRWAEALERHAQSDAVRAEFDYWRSLEEAPPAPTDSPSGDNLFASAERVSVALDEQATRALLQEVPSVYGTRIEEVLLTALALAWARWTGSDTLLVDLEGHGREDIVEGVDLSRTVGWFTTLYPARLALQGQHMPDAALQEVKRQVRGIPHRGIGFGLLRHLCLDPEISATMAAVPQPELSFLYLGQFDALAKSAPVRLLQEASGSPCSPDAPRGHLLEVVCYVIDGRLSAEWSYSTQRHERGTVEALARGFVVELRGLIAHCQASGSRARAPSDFPEARVSQTDLDTLLNRIGRGGMRSSE